MKMIGYHRQAYTASPNTNDEDKFNTMYLNTNAHINNHDILNSLNSETSPNLLQVFGHIIPYCDTQSLKAVAQSSRDLRQNVLQHSLQHLSDTSDARSVRNTAFSSSDISNLSLHGHLSDREFIASSPHTQHHILEQMRFDRSIDIKLQLAVNPKSTGLVLKEIFVQSLLFSLQSHSNALIKALSTNPSLPKYLFNDRAILNSKKGILKNPSTPTHALESIDVEKYAHQLAAHPNTSNLKIRLLAQLNDPEVDALLLQRASLPLDHPSCLQTREISILQPLNSVLVKIDINGTGRLFSIPLDVDKQLQLIQSKTPPEFLEFMAEHGSCEIQQAILNLEDLPEKVMQTLAISQHPIIHQDMVKQTQISKETLALLALSPVDKVRLKVAKRIKNDLNTAILLANDKQRSIRLHLLKHYPFSADIIHSLCNDTDTKNRIFIAKNCVLNHHSTKMLSQDPKIPVRQALLENSTIGTADLYAMRKDKAPEIAAQAISLFRKKVSNK